MAPRIHIVCINHRDDRVLPRFARLLRDRLGWTLDAAPDPTADVLYLSGYFEATRLKPWPDVPAAAYFTHREEEPPGNAKARLFDDVASKTQIRVAMCRLYAEPLSKYGPTVQPPLPVERDRFTIAAKPKRGRPIVGFSGYTYANHRKGEDLVKGIIASAIGGRVEWRASGRGWPVPTKGYPWAKMPEFYQGLDVLVCPSRVEGGPMPVLEALSCGVRVVIPKGVGILDEIPDTPGIYRYEKGDLTTMIAALEQAAFTGKRVNREALRQAVAMHSVDAFVEAHRQAFAAAFGAENNAGIAETLAQPVKVVVSKPTMPVNRNTGSKRGIYCVAFGAPARESAMRLMQTAKHHMPDIPICLCAASKIGPEDILITQPDSDVGGRRNKLRVYELAPAEWEFVLYLDADVEVVAPVYQFFEWIEDGWDFVICQDIDRMETVDSLNRKVTKDEVEETLRIVGSPHAQQYNGGVWSFRRNKSTARFFARWLGEWERYGQRDQGALLRALHAAPIRVFVLGNEWNTFPKFQSGVQTAGLLHFPGEARRWGGAIPGRIDSPEAWAMVKQFEARRAER